MIINQLTRDCQSQAASGLAYFYFDFTNHSISQDHNSLVRSLVEQLSSQNGTVPQPLKSLYHRCRNGTIKPPTADLVQVLRSICGIFSPCYLVIDAVDESKEKAEFLKLLATIVQWRLPQIHILLTSRTDIDTEVRTRNWNCVTVTVEEHLVDADVQKHVLATVQDDDTLNQWDSQHREVIITTLVDGAHGKSVHTLRLIRLIFCIIESNCDVFKFSMGDMPTRGTAGVPYPGRTRPSPQTLTSNARRDL